MSWHTNGPGSNKTRSGAHPVHTVTSATSPREHQRIKREQAEARNAVTLPHNTRRYRIDQDFRHQVDAGVIACCVAHEPDLTPAT